MACDTDFLDEVCNTLTTSVRCKCTDLTLLINACAEAAQFRIDHSMPHAEKYTAMESKLALLSEELDRRIWSRCKTLAKVAKTKKL